MYGGTASQLALAGAALHSLGWLLLGGAVVRCRLLNRGDGVLVMIAGPLLGFAGQLFGPLQAVGAFLLLAGGLGIALTVARLAPPSPPSIMELLPPNCRPESDLERQELHDRRGWRQCPAWRSASPTRTTSGSPTTGR